MEVIKANFNNQKHRALYENFCKKNHIAIERTSTIQKEVSQKMNFFLIRNNKILENCKIDLQKDLKKASLHIDKKKIKSQKSKKFTY